MSSQVPESKNDRKISVEIKKSRASNLSCSEGILICKIGPQFMQTGP